MSNSYISIGATGSVLADRVRVLDPAPAYKEATKHGMPKRFWGKANSLSCPRGKDPGDAWLLVRRGNLGSHYGVGTNNADASDEFPGWTYIGSGVLSIFWLYGGTEYEFPGWGLVEAVCLSPKRRNDPNALYLIHLQDLRKVIHWSTIYAQYNVRTPVPTIDRTNTVAFSNDEENYYSDSLNGGALWTWETMLANIWSNLITAAGSAPSFPYGSGISPSSPDGYFGISGTSPTIYWHPENYRFIGVSAWEAYYAVCQQLNLDIARNPLTDAYTMPKVNTDQDGLLESYAALEDRLIYDFEPVRTLNWMNYPDELVGFAWREQTAFGSEYEVESAEQTAFGSGQDVAGVVWDMQPALQVPGVGEVYGFTVPAAVGDTVYPRWLQTPAIFTDEQEPFGSLTPSYTANVSHLYSQVREFGASWGHESATTFDGNWNSPEANRNVSQLHKVYSGITTDILPGEQVSNVIWRDYGDDWGTCTEIINAPRQMVKLPQIAPDGIFVTGEAGPLKNAPTWPRLLHMIQIYDDGGEGDPPDYVEANGDNMFPALLYTMQDPTGETGRVYHGRCYVHPQFHVEPLINGSRYFARLAGTYDDGTDVFPRLTFCPEPQVFFGQLTSATVLTLWWNGSATSTTISSISQNCTSISATTNDFVCVTWTGNRYEIIA